MNELIDSLTEDFAEKPSFGLARYIWLLCYDEGRPPVAFVEEFFMNHLRGDDVIWRKKRVDSIWARVSSDAANAEIVDLKKLGLTFDEIAEKLNKDLTKPKHTPDSVRKRYERTNP